MFIVPKDDSFNDRRLTVSTFCNLLFGIADGRYDGYVDSTEVNNIINWLYNDGYPISDKSRESYDKILDFLDKKEKELEGYRALISITPVAFNIYVLLMASNTFKCPYFSFIRAKLMLRKDELIKKSIEAIEGE